jgi:FkbM family methyltransferase
VTSFEPLPALVTRLQDNIDLWQRRLGWDQVSVIATALSHEEGEAVLTMPSGFAENRGIATLEPCKSGEEVKITTRVLDTIFDPGRKFGVMKLDVEGHEYGVLKGASGLLSSGRIRDVVFEEHNLYPSEATRLLESHGYEILGLRKGILGPQLTHAADLKASLAHGETPNYLATRDAVRATERFRAFGWRALNH